MTLRKSLKCVMVAFHVLPSAREPVYVCWQLRKTASPLPAFPLPSSISLNLSSMLLGFAFNIKSDVSRCVSRCSYVMLMLSLSWYILRVELWKKWPYNPRSCLELWGKVQKEGRYQAQQQFDIFQRQACSWHLRNYENIGRRLAFLTHLPQPACLLPNPSSLRPLDSPAARLCLRGNGRQHKELDGQSAASASLIWFPSWDSLPFPSLAYGQELQWTNCSQLF